VEIKRVAIESVGLWDKNPRKIMREDFDRLKGQITKLGVYKPLLVYEDAPGAFIALGGNMRLRALKELGHKEVDISIVTPATEAEKLEYALSDNDRAGYTDEDKLAELLAGVGEGIDLLAYKVDSGKPDVTLEEIVKSVGPSDGAAAEEPELVFTEELLEENNYVVLFFDNEVDWLNALTTLGLSTYNPLHARPGFKSAGIGRVVRGTDAFEKIKRSAT
jgi:hypothetical protein